MIVLGGTASNGLDISLSKALGAELHKVETTKFPDGEIKVKVPEIDDGRVVIVQSTCHPQEKNLFELLLTAHALKSSKAHICAVVPYLAYARQNKSFSPGEAVSIEAVIDMMSAAGIKSLVTVNLHKSESLDYFKGKSCIANCAKTLAKGVKKQIDNPIVLAPDKSSLSVAEPAAEVLGCECTYIEKSRDSYGNVTIKEAHGGDFKGKNVVIFDDMIAAGGTVELAARFAYAEGAASVSAACVHLVMAYGAYDRLKNAGVTAIFGANTIPFDRAKIIDVSPDVAECVKKIFAK
jgi:ribose-phosphate pyrophosphokinase